MVNPEHHIAFGPVPSRRLGQSLGINNIPTKVCSYSCVYCQVGPTTDKTIELQRFFSAERTFESVESRLRKIEASGLHADYLTFVPDGEPTLDGIKRFAAEYPGTLISDTMLIAGTNDDTGHLSATAEFLAGIAPDTAYLAIPTRPTTLEGAQGTDEAGLIQAYKIFSNKLGKVELLTGHEVGDFGHTGNAREDLLAVTAVHPMREDDVRQLLVEDETGWELVDELLSEGTLKVVEYEGRKFYLRPVKCHRHMA